MTKEEKELLLKDLCARLPFKVKCAIYINDELKKDETIFYVAGDNVVTFESEERQECYMYWQIEPYLRPMSSMTEEEWVELGKIANDGEWIVANFYYSHHIDCWGLIPKGLALIAPEGMYNLNEE